MKGYVGSNGFQGNPDGDMKPDVKDYQPGMDQFAGVEMGKTNEYVSRTDRIVRDEAAMVRKQDYKGRYD
jgi:hypothetical protein